MLQVLLAKMMIEIILLTRPTRPTHLASILFRETVVVLLRVFPNDALIQGAPGPRRLCRLLRHRCWKGNEHLRTLCSHGGTRHIVYLPEHIPDEGI
jgi:hypothetical protein